MRVTLTGIDDVQTMLTKIAPRQAKNIMRATIHGVAGEIRNDAKAVMPVDSGDMKRETKAKRERGRPGYIQSTVRVGRKGFYWRFMEYGQGPAGVEYAMFLKAVEKFRGKMHRTFVEQFGKKWEAALARAAKRNGG
jgi:HK97 gp10 family phage protein